MIERIICEDDSSSNYEQLTEDRKLIYQEFYKDTALCPERYVISVDVASPNIKDQSCAVRYNYEEYLKGNLVIDSVKYF
jgi:hypothetical protein